MAAAVMRNSNSEGTYTFSSQPRAVTQRKKFRPTQEDGSHVYYGNIMHDRRVIRGNTYSQHILPTSAGVDPVDVHRQQESRRNKAEATVRRQRRHQHHRLSSPGPVEGRRHIDIQTEIYLEELNDRSALSLKQYLTAEKESHNDAKTTTHMYSTAVEYIVVEVDVECQTDAFLDRPPSPLFVPAKTGVDCGTQIEAGELFDSNLEVAPILEVLVGKTVEQALLEVMEEEELAALREQQRMFEELRNAEMSEYQRLEEQERRHKQEKERRMKEQAEILKQQKESADKIAAHAFAQNYMSDLIPSVFNNLERNGYFYDTVEREIENDYLPWLEEGVEKKLELQSTARRLVDSIIRDAVRRRREEFSQMDAAELELKKQEQQIKQLMAETVDDKVTADVEEEKEEEEENKEQEEQEEEEEEQEEVLQDPENAENTENAANTENAENTENVKETEESIE